MTELNEILQAAERIGPYLYRTPFEYNPILSRQTRCSVYLKLENQQVSGSFKARGAYNKILSYSPESRNKHFFTAASTGNHAAAFCSALKSLNLKGKVFLPENVAPSKLEFIKSMEVPFELFGQNSLHTEVHCRQWSEQEGYTMVHPYNDDFIVAGQGTVALEMLDQQPDIDVVIAPVGGGGLISGIGKFIKNKNPQIHLVGCQPTQSPEMIRSIECGYIIQEDISLPTLSDGTAGGMEPGSITFNLCQKYVDEWALLEESKIAFEIANMLQINQLLIEGAAALPLAYLRKYAHLYENKKVGLVITGKRISIKKVRDLLGQYT